MSSPERPLLSSLSSSPETSKHPAHRLSNATRKQFRRTQSSTEPLNGGEHDDESSFHAGSTSGIYFSTPPRRTSQAVLNAGGRRSRDYGSFGVPSGKGESRGMYLIETDLDTNDLTDHKALSTEAFVNMPVEEEEIKKVKKKLRPYYQNMAAVQELYAEVDELLNSALPSTIATQFRGMKETNGEHEVTHIGQADGTNGNAHGAGVSREDTVQWLGAKSRHGRSGSGDVGRGNGEVDLGEDAEDQEEDEPLLPASAEKAEKREARNRLALNVNFLVNAILLTAKALAVISSSSVSLVASFVDAALDFLSTLIIFVSSLAMGRKGDKHKYPVGKKRFEPLGVLIFSVAMIASFCQVFIESFQRAIAKGEENPTVAELSWFGIGTMIATIVIKSVIWLWCSRIPSTAVKALAQDAENDVWFNIMSLAFPWLGGLLKWRLLDPIGGMVLSLYIIYNWVMTLGEQFSNLSGRAADPSESTRILYLVSRFKPVLQISYCEIYHIGDEVIVEVDVILPKRVTLGWAHDVTETLQGLIESLDGVARAYVHADYSKDNPAQHRVAESGPQPPKNKKAVPPNANAGKGATAANGAQTP